jgi:hypothetical protein
VSQVSLRDFERGYGQISSRDHKATVRLEEGGDFSWQCTDRPDPFGFVDTAEVFGFRVGRVSERHGAIKIFDMHLELKRRYWGRHFWAKGTVSAQ